MMTIVFGVLSVFIIVLALHIISAFYHNTWKRKYPEVQAPPGAIQKHNSFAGLFHIPFAVITDRGLRIVGPQQRFTLGNFDYMFDWFNCELGSDVEAAELYRVFEQGLLRERWEKCINISTKELLRMSTIRGYAKLLDSKAKVSVTCYYGPGECVLEGTMIYALLIHENGHNTLLVRGQRWNSTNKDKE